MNTTETFATNFAQKYSFDPTVIIGIITALMEIFQNCQQPASDVAEAVKSPGPFRRARATRVVMDNLPELSRRQARRVADELVEEAARTPTETIVAAVSECCSNKW